MKTTNKTIKIYLILKKLEIMYNKNELQFIFEYLLKLNCFESDVTNCIENITDRGNCLYYLDNLSVNLTEYTNINQPVFILSQTAYEILNQFEYDKRELQFLTYDSVLHLLDVTDRINWQTVDLSELTGTLKPVLKKYLLSLPVFELVSVFDNISKYNFEPVQTNWTTIKLFESVTGLFNEITYEEIILLIEYIL